MAEIDIERKPSRKGAWAVAVILLVLAVGAAAWYLLAGPGQGTF